MPVPKVKKSVHWIDRNGEVLWAALSGLFYLGLGLSIGTASPWLFVCMLCLFVVSVRALNNFTPASQRRKGLVSYAVYPLMAWRQ
ncbi:hypothetical protein GCM10007385_28740 [Tateyamaria omphalii]|nr:hypothetical protein GCM10007385_28740 [Tateyamaria omphalii]